MNKETKIAKGFSIFQWSMIVCMGFSISLGNQLALLISLFSCLFGFLEPRKI